ncbi:MAG: hypothetical protein WA061_02150 [Microgenomates group bacterium]
MNEFEEEFIERRYLEIMEEIKGSFVYGIPIEVEDERMLVVAAYMAGLQSTLYNPTEKTGKVERRQ